MSGERVGKVIPSVDQIAEASADAGLWKGAWKEMSEAERDVIRQRAEGVHAMLEEHLGPFLRELEAEVKRLGDLLEFAEQQNEAFRSQSR